MNNRFILKTKQHVVECVNSNRLAEAGKAAEKLCHASPGDPESWCLLGFVEDRRSNTQQAVTAYRKAVAIDPRYYEAAYNLGVNLIATGDLNEAERAFQRARSIRPNTPDAINNLGIVFRQRGELEQAAANFRQATQIDPQHFMAWLNLGNACRQLFLREEAVSCYRQALKIDPANNSVRYSLADILILLGKFDEAVNQLNKVLGSVPGDIDALAGKVEALEKKGDRRSAFDLIQGAREGNPLFPRLALTYANLCHEFDVCGDAMVWLESLLGHSNTRPEDAASLHQAAAKILDKQSRFHEAFGHYSQANQIKISLGEKSGHLEDMDNSLSFFPQNSLERLPHASNESELPVFIIGMPRSGTSLVEQIVASHPEACGAGELPYIHRFVSNLPGLSGSSDGYPQCLQNVDSELLDVMAAEYLDHLNKVCPDAKRITDKLPHNFMWLGMIELMFPRARIIHCMREPMDNCLSLYTTRGFNAHHSYVFDLEKLGEHYCKYEEIMLMWRDTLSLPVLELKYENLVSDFEVQAKRLVEFCGLEWDESCLRYYESGRLSATLSYDQVRKPIYSSSVGRWRHYEEFLLPLKTALRQKEGAS